MRGEKERACDKNDKEKERIEKRSRRKRKQEQRLMKKMKGDAERKTQVAGEEG